MSRYRTTHRPIATREITPWLRASAGVALAFCAGVAFTAITAEAGSPGAKNKRDTPALSANKKAKALSSEVKTKPKHTVPKDWQAAGLDLSKAVEQDGRLVQFLPSGAKVTFTVQPQVQQHLSKMYDNRKVPHGGVVLLEPDSGRVMALLSHSALEPKMDDMAVIAHAPSASVFKIITAAALVEDKGVNPEGQVCYHGGRSSLSEANIKGDKRLDRSCGTLSDAVAWSINSLIAKLAYQKLSRQDLNAWAKKFGYNETIPFELPVAISKAQIPEEPLERARAAAGFWHTFLSPLHGAMIGAAVLNEGVMMQPTLIERYEAPDGELLYSFKPRVWRRAMSAKTAKTVRAMTDRTATVGTARKYFKQRAEMPKHITAGGKTGTLSRKQPSYLGYTWFVGYAEDTRREGAQIAVAGLTCNTPIWQIKGPYAASEAVRKYMEVVGRQASAVAER